MLRLQGGRRDEVHGISGNNSLVSCHEIRKSMRYTKQPEPKTDCQNKADGDRRIESAFGAPLIRERPHWLPPCSNASRCLALAANCGSPCHRSRNLRYAEAATSPRPKRSCSNARL